MSRQVAGQEGAGSVVVYQLGPAESATLESIHFTVETDATAGVHQIRLLLEIPTVGTIARLDDLNEAGPSQTNFYTYALGLAGSACTLPSGLAVTDALPDTQLPPGATITVEAITGAGVEIAGDQISAVLLQLSGAAVQAAPPEDLPLFLLPGSAAA